jgi:hypothetical protein
MKLQLELRHQHTRRGDGAWFIVGHLEEPVKLNVTVSEKEWKKFEAMIDPNFQLPRTEDTNLVVTGFDTL